MNYQKVVKEVHKDLKSAGLSMDQKTSKEILDTTINTITDLLVKGHDVQLYNFATFKLILVDRKNMANPTERIKRWSVKFILSNLIKNKLNQDIKDAEKKRSNQ